jgi:tetratricopeptide (TPR) repeat protein
MRRLKNRIDADHWLTRSLQWDPRDAQAWFYLGRTKYSESQFPEAIEAFAQCLKLEPRNIQAENNVGLSYEALGQRDQAIQAFKNAIAWEVQSPAKDPEPFIEIAHLYLNQNQPEKAVPYLSQSIAIFPRVSKAHETLGKAYSLLHRLPEAQTELEKAVALEPERASLHCMLGQIYRQERMVSEAKAEFDRCSALQQTQSASPSGTE